MSEAGAYDIFISYTREDAEPAKRLADELTRQGWTVFWDRMLLPGTTWRTQIQAALSGARVVVVLWSQRSVESRWVEIEADHAFQRDVYLPVKIDAAPLPLGLSHIQVADLRQWHAAPGQPLPDVLVSALQRRLGGQSAPPPPARRPPAAPAPTDDDDGATRVAVDRTIRLAGRSRDGAPFELSIRLSQLRMRPDGLVIGRKAGQADLVLAHESVSRRHAVVVSSDGRLTVSDLGSTNGTFVDDKPALRERPAELVRGAVLRLGEVELTVEGVLA
ncbi:MAG: TIR domain-containing protein [Enhydrobacter sp.]|nr:MAG: TIR domain-containing protein [Enhydrobacter sp.]